MKKTALNKYVAIWGILAVVACCIVYAYSYQSKKYTYTLPAAYSHPSIDALPWIHFKWFGSEIKGIYMDRHALCIPVKIDALPDSFYFQFDMGSTYTMLYENSLQPYLDKYPQLNSKLVKRRSPLIFWDHAKDFTNLKLTLGTVPFTGRYTYIKHAYGRVLNNDSIATPSQKTIGTIGVDLLQHHVLIIDYPNCRICIMDTLPPLYHPTFTPFYLSRQGKVVLQMKYHNQIFNVIFDTGSSMFSLLTTGERFYQFSVEDNNDTIPIVSWGEVHNVIGRPMPGTMSLNNIPFSNVEVYGDYRLNDELLKEEWSDAITGNALFWDKVVVIDFRNKLFGVM
jgi:hypothetical protein